MVENEWLENDIDSFKFPLVYLDPFSLPDVPNKDNSRIIIYIYIRHILGIFYTLTMWSYGLSFVSFFLLFCCFPSHFRKQDKERGYSEGFHSLLM